MNSFFPVPRLQKSLTSNTLTKKIFVNHLNNLQDEKETRDMTESEPKKKREKEESRRRD